MLGSLDFFRLCRRHGVLDDLHDLLGDLLGDLELVDQGSLHRAHLVLLLLFLELLLFLLFLFHHLHLGVGVHLQLTAVGEFVGASLKGCGFAVLAHDADVCAGGELLGFSCYDPAIIEAGFGVEVLTLRIDYGTDGLLEFFNNGHGSSFHWRI